MKSWDVTAHRKTFMYLIEIINPAGWCHLPSWVLKPYFVQEVVFEVSLSLLLLLSLLMLIILVLLVTNHMSGLVKDFPIIWSIVS